MTWIRFNNFEDTGWVISTATSHDFTAKADGTWYTRKVTVKPDDPNPTVL